MKMERVNLWNIRNFVWWILGRRTITRLFQGEAEKNHKCRQLFMQTNASMKAGLLEEISTKLGHYLEDLSADKAVKRWWNYHKNKTNELTERQKVQANDKRTRTLGLCFLLASRNCDECRNHKKGWWWWSIQRTSLFGGTISLSLFAEKKQKIRYNQSKEIFVLRGGLEKVIIAV